MDSIKNQILPLKGIIIEGVECSGKTTLIQRLRSDVIAYDCVMLGHQEGDQFDRYMREYMLNSRVIFNRSHYSEMVYSHLWQRESPFSVHEVSVLDSYLARNYITLLCTADIDTLAARYQGRDFKQKANIDELKAIKSLFESTLNNKADYIYHSNDASALDKVLDYVRACLNDRAQFHRNASSALEHQSLSTAGIR